MPTTTELYGLMAEFDHPEPLVNAAREVYEAGYRKIDAFAPMPVDGLAEAIGFRSNAVSQLVFVAGLSGAIGGFGLMYWISVIAYPHIVAGRPLNSWPAYIPVTFECMVLLACLTAVLSMLILNGLPQPYHPVFNAIQFERASSDRFFLCIEAADPLFDEEVTRRFLEELHPREVMDVAP
jgi:hypothetical protein